MNGGLCRRPAYAGGTISGFRSEGEIELPAVFVVSLVAPIDESTASYSYDIVNCMRVETRYSWEGVKTPAHPEGLSGTEGPMSAKLVHTELAGGRILEVMGNFTFEWTGVADQKSAFMCADFCLVKCSNARALRADGIAHHRRHL
ncbi:MAG: hypothetical protein O7H41_16485 [Planctomycetota bacterium]|nr:hypothetical protein [Planctomycetota bacterium]